MKPEFILNATDMERGLRLDRSDPEDRARIVALIDILLDALEMSFDQGLSRNEVLLWLDADIGEGSLFRSISAGIPTMLSFEFDTSGHLEGAIEDLSEVTERYKPEFLLLRVLNAASELGPPDPRSDAGRFALKPSPIENHISLYDSVSTFGVDIGWDIRKPRGEWPDPLVQSENALQTITLFQDSGLDPSIWVMNLPTVKIVAEVLSSRTHIDDRNDVMACFALEPIFWNAFRDQNEDLYAVPQAVMNATRTVTEIPGNAKAVVGGETYAKCLNQYAQDMCDAEDAAEAIAARFMALSEELVGEGVAV